MEAPTPIERFVDSFAVEMGRWSARVVAGGLTVAGGILLTHLIG